MERSSWATICHADFPNTILSLEECKNIVHTLNRLDSGNRSLIQTAIIKIGWVGVRFSLPQTLDFLRKSIPNLEQNLTSHLIVLSFEPPDFNAIFIDIPSSIAETNEETLRIIQKGGPNRDLWKIVCVSERDGFHKLVLSIPQRSVAELQLSDCIIKYKGQPFTVRLEVFKRKGRESDYTSPGSSAFRKSQQKLGSDSGSPGFEKQTTSQENSENVLARRLYNHLRKLNIASKEANERSRNVMIRYKKFKLDTKKNCSLGKHGYDFFNVEFLFNRLECLQLIDEIAQATDYSENNFFILCHQDFPKVFIEPSTLISVKEKLTEFNKTIPLKLAIGSICDAEGCIKVYHGNEGTFKFMRRVVECQQSWTVVTCADIPKFRCVALALPCYKVTEHSNDLVLSVLKRENSSLNCGSWCIASRSPETGILKIVMNVPSYRILEKASFNVNFLGNPYTAQPLPELANNETELKTSEIEGDVSDAMQEERKRLTEVLIGFGLSSDAADRRSQAAICKYQQFMVLAWSSSIKGFTFCNGEILSDHFENIQLFDEMLTQRVEMSTDKCFMLCHVDFPNTFFNHFNLTHITNRLKSFLSELPVQPAVGDICIEEGWLKVYYGNEGTIKWLKRVVQFTHSKMFPLKLLPKVEVPQFYFIFLKVPIEEQNDSMTLLNLKEENQKLDTNSWEIARRVSCDSNNEILTIIMNLDSIVCLKNHSWLVSYLDTSYVTKAYHYRVENGVERLTPDEESEEEEDTVEAADVEPDEMLKETRDLFEYIQKAGVSVYEAQERTAAALTKYKQLKLLFKKNTNNSNLFFYNKKLLEDNLENLILFDELLMKPIKSKPFILCHKLFPKQFFLNEELNYIKMKLCTFLRKSPVQLSVVRCRDEEGWLCVDGASEATVKWLKRVVNFTESATLPLMLLIKDEIPDFFFIKLKVPADTFNSDVKLEYLKKENPNSNSWEIPKIMNLAICGSYLNIITILMDAADFDELKKKSFTVFYLNNSYLVRYYIFDSIRGLTRSSDADDFISEKALLLEKLTQAGVSSSEADRRGNAACRRYKFFKKSVEKSSSEPNTFIPMEILEHDLENLLFFDEMLTMPSRSSDIHFILCHKLFPRNSFPRHHMGIIEKNLTECIEKAPVRLKIGETSLEESWLSVNDASDATMKWFNWLLQFTDSTIYPLTLITKDEISKFSFIKIKIPTDLDSIVTKLENLKKENSNSDSWQIVHRIEIRPAFELISILMNAEDFEVLKMNAFYFRYLNNTYKATHYSYDFKKGLVRIPDNMKVYDLITERGQVYDYLTKAGLSSKEADQRTEAAINAYRVFEIKVKKPLGDSFRVFPKEILEDSVENIILFDEILAQPQQCKQEKFILAHKSFPKVFLRNAFLCDTQNQFNDILSVIPAIGKISVEEGWFSVTNASEATFKWLQRVLKFQKPKTSPMILLTKNEITDFFFFTMEVAARHCKGKDNDSLLKILGKENSNYYTASWVITRRVPVNSDIEILTILMDLPAFEALRLSSFCVRYYNKPHQVQTFKYSFEKGTTPFDIQSLIQEEKMKLEKAKLHKYLMNRGISSDMLEQRSQIALEKYNEFKHLVKKNSSSIGFTFYHEDIIKDDFINLMLFDNMLEEPERMSDDKYFILCHLHFPDVFLNEHNLIRIQNRLGVFLKESPVRPAIGDVIVDEGWLMVHYGNEAALKWLKRVVKCTETAALPLKLLTKDMTPNFGFVHLKLPFRTLEKFGIDAALRYLVRDNAHLNCQSWKIARCAIKDEQDDVTLVMDITAFNALHNYSFFLQFLGNVYRCEPYEFNHRGTAKTTSANTSEVNYVEKMLYKCLCEMGVEELEAKHRANTVVTKYEKVASVYGSFSDPGVLETVKMFDAMITQPVEMSDDKFCILCHPTFPLVFLDSTVLDSIYNALYVYMSDLPFEPAIGKVISEKGWVKINYGNEATYEWLVRITKFQDFISLGVTLMTPDQVPRFWAVTLTVPPWCIHMESIPTVLTKLKSENESLDCRSWLIAGRKTRPDSFEEIYIVMNGKSFDRLQDASFNILCSGGNYETEPCLLYNSSDPAGCFVPNQVSENSVQNADESSGMEINETGEKSIKDKEVELELKLQKLKQLQLELKLQKLQKEFQEALKEKEKLKRQKSGEGLTESAENILVADPNADIKNTIKEESNSNISLGNDVPTETELKDLGDEKVAENEKLEESAKKHKKEKKKKSKSKSKDGKKKKKDDEKSKTDKKNVKKKRGASSSSSSSSSHPSYRKSRSPSREGKTIHPRDHSRSRSKSVDRFLGYLRNKTPERKSRPSYRRSRSRSRDRKFSRRSRDHSRSRSRDRKYSRRSREHSRSRSRDRKFSRRSRNHSRSRSTSIERGRGSLLTKTAVAMPGGVAQSSGYLPQNLVPPPYVGSAMPNPPVPQGGVHTLPVTAPNVTTLGISNVLPNLHPPPLNVLPSPQLVNPIGVPNAGVPISNATISTPYLQSEPIAQHLGVENITHINIFSHTQINANEIKSQPDIPLAAPLIEKPKDAYEYAIQQFYQRLHTKESSKKKDREKSRSRSRSRERYRRKIQRSRSSSRNRSYNRSRRSRSRERRPLKYESESYRSRIRYSPNRSRQIKDLHHFKRIKRSPPVERRRDRSRSRSKTRKHIRSRSRSSSSDKTNRKQMKSDKESSSKRTEMKTTEKSREVGVDGGESIVKSESIDGELSEGHAENTIEDSVNVKEETTGLAEDVTSLPGVPGETEEADNHSNPPNPLDSAGQEKLHTEFNTFLDELKDLCNYFKSDSGAPRPENQEE